VLGALSAANATGQLVFLPLLASVIEQRGWRTAALVVSGAAVIVFAVVLVFMRDRPEDLGLGRYGQQADEGSGTVARALSPLDALAHAAKSRAFWILAGTFFVCGASTNGLIGTHLIAACHDYGIPQMRSAQLLAVMGIFDILGTTASGWLTDRYSSRHLLFGYYTLRGLSLLCLPFTLEHGAQGLGWFAVFYGLDWVATVPPTVRLVSEAFGRENTGVVYGWIGASHQLGASLAAFGAGAIRTVLGDYSLAFWIAGALCILAGGSFLTIGRRTFRPMPSLEKLADVAVS
jgi:predicted MFS family arabinose efflux permease